jgi:sec-independent protein translocase protein TatB
MELFGIGWTEMLVIGIVALIVVGPQRLPEVARTIGRAIGYFSQQWRNIQQQIREPIENEVNHIKGDIQQVRDPIEGEVRNIKGSIQDFKDEISGTKPRSPKAKAKASEPAEPAEPEESKRS